MSGTWTADLDTSFSSPLMAQYYNADFIECSPDERNFVLGTRGKGLARFPSQS